MIVIRVVVLFLLAVGAAYGWCNFRLYYLQLPEFVLAATLSRSRCTRPVFVSSTG